MCFLENSEDYYASNGFYCVSTAYSCICIYININVDNINMIGYQSNNYNCIRINININANNINMIDYHSG